MYPSVQISAAPCCFCVPALCCVPAKLSPPPFLLRFCPPIREYSLQSLPPSYAVPTSALPSIAHTSAANDQWLSQQRPAAGCQGQWKRRWQHCTDDKQEQERGLAGWLPWLLPAPAGCRVCACRRRKWSTWGAGSACRCCSPKQCCSSAGKHAIRAGCSGC